MKHKLHNIQYKISDNAHICLLPDTGGKWIGYCYKNNDQLEKWVYARISEREFGQVVNNTCTVRSLFFHGVWNEQLKVRFVVQVAWHDDSLPQIYRVISSSKFDLHWLPEAES